MQTIETHDIADNWVKEVVVDALAVVHSAERARTVTERNGSWVGRQGDVALVRRGGRPPADQVTIERPDKTERLCVVKGEARRNDHNVKVRKGEFLRAKPGGDPFVIGWLVTEDEFVMLHEGPDAEHAPIIGGPGVWEFRQQHEQFAEGWRRVQD